MTRILYRSDERVKYELLLCLKEISEEFKSCVSVLFILIYLKKQDPSSIVSLIKIFIKYMPQG
jgi:hypothetical protein